MFDNFIIGFIGLGLIGGSLARIIKEKHPNTLLLAYDYHKDAPSIELQKAKKDGVIDRITENLDPDFSACRIIFLCSPVLSNIAYLEQLKPIIRSDCLITDVGSVKGNIHSAVTRLGLDSNFIGGHPMAGSEKTGYLHSHNKLFENAYYILTPTVSSSSFMLDWLFQLTKEANAIPIILSPKEHDNITAVISHVPHIIASALVHMVQTEDTDGKMAALAAGGFKDITRIASSSPIMWQNICLTNTESILYFLEKFSSLLLDLRNYLSKQDSLLLFQFFEAAKEFRDSLPSKGNGIFPNMYEIYLDLIDETGAIATIATILASNHISIKNIGIVHNREWEEGVLRIEFYNETALQNAVSLLSRYHYTLYPRS